MNLERDRDIFSIAMTADHAENRTALWRSFGGLKPPERVTQEAFERDDRHLRRLARLRPGEKPKVADLWEYTQDLLYTEIETSLFAYLLPFCLEIWREELRGIHTECGGFIEFLYPVLADRQVFSKHLTPKQGAAVSEFMRQSILEEIDDQCGLAFQGMGARPYRWVGALTTFGVLLPDMDRLWTDWWLVATVGRAVAAVQYISCLMYSEYENPVFAPWTPIGGGGPPCLWEFEGHLYTNRWIEVNVNFLAEVLHAARVKDVLARAVERLVGQPEQEVASEILEDFLLCIETVESRCAELPLLLATNQEAGLSLEWSK